MTVHGEIADQGQYIFAKNNQDVDHLEKYIGVEVIMVANPNTVVNPRTVMVKTLHATTTYVAVATARRTNRLAVWTQVYAADYIKHVHKLNFFIFDVAWLLAGSQSKEYQGQGKSDKKCDCCPHCDIYDNNIGENRDFHLQLNVKSRDSMNVVAMIPR